MRRRVFITLLGGTAASWPLAARAQKRTALIGLLGSGSAQSSGIFVDSLREGLSDSGLREGRDYVLDLRWAKPGAVHSQIAGAEVGFGSRERSDGNRASSTDAERAGRLGAR